MDTHYHLLIKTPNGNLVQALHHVQNTYVKSFNAAHKRVGPLFQGRYKSIVVVDQHYLKELSRYIHLNPIRKNLEKRLGNYEWNSYRFYSGQNDFPEWVRPDELLELFGSDREQARLNHRAYVESGRDLPAWDPFSVAAEGIILGSMKLLRILLNKEEPHRVHLSTGLVLDKLFTVDDIVTTISDIFDIPVEQLVSRGFSRSVHRKAAIYLSRRHTRLSLQELGSYFGGVSYGSIAWTYRACRKLLTSGQGTELAEVLGTIETKLQIV
jgi:putative transposase